MPLLKATANWDTNSTKTPQASLYVLLFVKDSALNLALSSTHMLAVHYYRFEQVAFYNLGFEYILWPLHFLHINQLSNQYDWKYYVLSCINLLT